MIIKISKITASVMPKLWLLVLFFGIGNNTFSQYNKISAKGFFGVIFPHHEVIYSQVNSPITSLELSYSNILHKDSIWDNLYNQPEFGVNLFYTSLGNESVFGNEIALFPSVTFNMIKKQDFSFYSRFGLGLSYVTETYNQESNIKNYAASKPFNIHFDFLLGANYKLLDKLEIKGGIKIGHFSNGNTSFPNMGMNYISTYVGFGYLFNESPTLPKSKKQIKSPDEKNFNLFASFGFRNNRIKTRPFTLTLLYQKSISNKILLGGGIDLSYDKFVEFELKRKNQDFKSSNNLYSGLFVNQSLRYKNWLLSLQEGIYFIDNKLQNLAYFKTSLTYCFSNNYYLRTSLKTHSFTADYTEIGIGYKF